MSNLKSAIIARVSGSLSVYQKDKNMLVHRQIVSATYYVTLDLAELIATVGSINNLIIKLDKKGFKSTKNGFIVCLDGGNELGRIQVTDEYNKKSGWLIDDIQSQVH